MAPGPHLSVGKVLSAALLLSSSELWQERQQPWLTQAVLPGPAFTNTELVCTHSVQNHPPPPRKPNPLQLPAHVPPICTAVQGAWLEAKGPPSTASLPNQVDVGFLHDLQPGQQGL